MSEPLGRPQAPVIPLALALLVHLSGVAGAGVIVRDAADQTVVLYDRSYALLIGVSDYTAGWKDLPSIPGELAQVESVLNEHDFEVTRVLNPTEDELRQSFERFIDAHGYVENHRLLVFFAGHGYSRSLSDGRQRGYLVPSDGPLPTDDPSGFLGKAVSMVDVDTLARRIESRHALFVFDSCFSGTVFDTRGAPSEPSYITAKTGRSVRQFLTAGSAGEEVPARSLFTPAFVRALRGAGDLVRDGYVTGTELGVYLGQEVRYPGQTPQSGRLPGYHEGDFVFRVGLQDAVPTAAFDLEDLRARADLEASWSTYQRDLEAAFAEVEQLEAGDAGPSTKTHAWQRFLKTFRDDNPHSAEDERLRQIATGRVEHWRSRIRDLAVEAGADGELDGGTLWTDPAIGMVFRYIPRGTFLMGSPETELGRGAGETRHEVTLSRGFWIGETEVTQEQWRAVIGNDPSRFSSCGRDCPVENVNWFEAVAFANALSEKAGYTPCYGVSGANGRRPGDGLEYRKVDWSQDCIGYRLPTEAEWERAARGGRSTALYTGSLTIKGQRNGPELGPIAWYGGNSGVSYPGGVGCAIWKERQVPDSRTCGPHPVAGKDPNPWGLHDTLGNVSEWTWDWSGRYGEEAALDPTGAIGGGGRVCRGGSWASEARRVRTANRGVGLQGQALSTIGFRLARGQVPAAVQESQRMTPEQLLQELERYRNRVRKLRADE